MENKRLKTPGMGALNVLKKHGLNFPSLTAYSESKKKRRDLPLLPSEWFGL